MEFNKGVFPNSPSLASWPDVSVDSKNPGACSPVKMFHARIVQVTHVMVDTGGEYFLWSGPLYLRGS